MDMVDYQKFCPQGTPAADRKKMNVGNIFSNSVQCLKCSDIIRSINRYHMPRCSCGNVFIDGGSWYTKLIGNTGYVLDLIETYLTDEEINNLKGE